MKNFSTLAAAALLIATTLFSGCFATDGNTTLSPAYYGYEIYSSVVPQNLISEDPFNVAVRLNILISTANAQDLPLNKAVIEDHGEEENLWEHLFGENEITVDSEGDVYTLTFTPGANETNVGETDQIRKGTLLVATGGKLLEELGSGETWTVSAPGNNYQIGLKDSYGNTIYFKVSLANGYTITAAGGNQWNVFAPEMASENANKVSGGTYYDGVWTINYDLSYSSLNMTYTSFHSSKITQTGSAEGIPVGYSLKFSYDILSELIHDMNCSPAAIGSGTVRVQAHNLTVSNGDRYPSDYVRIKWKTTGCSQYFYLGYDGKVYDQSGNETTTETV